ncbi:MAG: glycoside hydrolase family 2 TIM barrel-domain containing protein, partial [Verrucomicrobiota bacterium]
DSPWLYQAQVEVVDKKGKVLDVVQKQFGMRSFRMDEGASEIRGQRSEASTNSGNQSSIGNHQSSMLKGRFYFNEREIRLRGANTMGHMQQCVMKKDWDQLRDDILLAKICNMNFYRLTQRPVQPEIYEYCDRLGMMTQTDLPLFAMLRRNQFVEAIRQTEEMERLVRNHPCNIMVSYINEPFPNAGHGKAHRHLERHELEAFFASADKVVQLANPDRVIKAVDGDYDPPAPGLPDNHCYNGWYNGHGLDLGKLHKGFWQKVKPGWNYGCGEFGSEGLESVDLMRKYYPKEWLPSTAEEEKRWSPKSIIKAQGGNFHYVWHDTEKTLEDWVDSSQAHQRWVTQLMTEAFRRDNRMNTFAIHLFIDAFPAGWMKTIMDCERQPKPAFFAYRDALTPLMANLRTDRFKYFGGEEVSVEAWLCNDLPETPKGCSLCYQLEQGGKVLFSGKQKASIPVCSSAFQGSIRFAVPEVETRTPATLRLGLLDKDGKVLHDNSIEIEIFPKVESAGDSSVVVVGSKDGKAACLAKELGLKTSSLSAPHSTLFLIDDVMLYKKQRKEIDAAVKNGAVAIFVELPEGKCKIADSDVEIEKCGMRPVHFVS